MSHFLDRLTFFKRIEGEFADGHGITTNEDRRWEDGYRKRWQHDKIVRSTHGANCTGSCSWKIYVKGGIVTWETQQTDYPRTRPDLPNHEPRGCSRGASYSWYLYSGNRVKYPLVRSRLLKLWREARAMRTPVAAWASIVENPEKRAAYTKKRGLGGFVRATWDEVTEIIAAANAYTAKTYGPDRVIGFSPIPAMSMVSYAAGSRYLSLLGGVCMSFYDWYCDLPPASPQTWGEQTDVPESADWYNSGFLIIWGSNVPQTRTPDAHFYTEVRYKGAKSVVICPDYSEASKFADLWISVKQGTDAALAMAMGHVILREFYIDRQAEYFEDYARQYTDMPMLVRLVKQGDSLVPDRLLRASDFPDNLGETNNPEWKTVAYDETSESIVVPQGSVGFRWGEKGKWNLEEKETGGRETNLQMSFANDKDELADVAFPYFGNREHDHFAGTDHPSVLVRKVPAKRVQLKDGEALVASVFDLFVANYGVDRGFGGAHVAKSYDENVPYTPAWAEKISGVPRDQIIQIAREFARNAEKTKGRSMIIIGAAMNHWFHCDMNYRGVINMLVMCGCVGQSGGGWSHYVGQEKLRPQSGWLPLAFGLDWSRPPRQQNSTSFFYAHTDQWRYETLDVGEIISPTAPAGPWDGALIDYNVRAERMGWLPSAPQLETNPLELSKKIAASGKEAEGLRGRRAEVGRAEALLPRPGQSQELAAQHVRVALEPAGLIRQGARVFPQAPARHVARRDGQAAGRDGRAEAHRCRLARRSAGRKARPARHARLPHVDHLRLLRHRAADRHLVREERPQHLRHASLHPPADAARWTHRGRRAATGRSTRRSPRSSPRSRPRCWASRRTWCSRPSCTTRRPRSRRRSTSRTGSAANASRWPARPCRRSPSSSATTPTSTSASRRWARSCPSSATAARAWPGTPSTRSISSSA